MLYRFVIYGVESGVATQICNPGTWNAEARELHQTPGQPGLQANLGY